MKDFDERRLLEVWPSVRYRIQWKSDILFGGSRLAGLLGYCAPPPPSLAFIQPQRNPYRSKYFVYYSATFKFANDLWWRCGGDSFAPHGTIDGINLTIT